MLPFAHIGITLAIFYIAAQTFPKIRPHIRYTYVIVGSLLPDIIDKLIGRVLFADTFASGRIFAHSLLFVLVLGTIGYLLFARRRDSRILLLAVASFIHQVLDSMWQAPQTFLWPVLGLEFSRGTGYGSFWQYFSRVYIDQMLAATPSTAVIAEIAGVCIILLFITVRLKNLT